VDTSDRSRWPPKLPLAATKIRQNSMMRPSFFNQHRVRENQRLRSSAPAHITHSLLQIPDEC
jgi:hypothetical protein